MGVKPRPVIDRFAEKVALTENGCHEWTGHIARNGYGRFQDQQRTGHVASAHRFSYEYYIGPIPDGLHIDHLCRNRACVNPDHLEAVTPRENLLRGVGFPATNAAKTHCPAGHEYAGRNLRIDAKNRRVCRECHRINAAARRARGKAA